MTGRAVKALIAIVLGIGVCGVGALMGLAGVASACTPTLNAGATSATTSPGASTASASQSTATSPPDLSGYNSEQLANAATIAAVGTGRGIPTRGLIIAVATAIQESSLRNLGDLGANNDHDSLGLFQQRPSQGWGTPQQLQDPVYASNKFYDELLAVPNWEQLPLTEAAQAVQHSATVGAYAKWEADATALVAVVGSTIPGANPGVLGQCLSNCSEITSNTAAGLGNPQPAAIEPGLPSGSSASGLLKISGWGSAQEVRNGQSSTLTVAQGFAEPTAVSYGMYGGCTGGDGMSGDGATLPADFTLPANTPDAVALAIFWAFEQLGTPYTFGGSCTDPHSGDPSKQCDCSSLMQQAYRNGGISLPRVTNDQQHVGTRVASVADLLPGDLIFIPGSDGSMADPGHVGMYIGDGLLIQAPHTGDVVKLSKVWQEIATIRRVVTWPPAVTAAT